MTVAGAGRRETASGVRSAGKVLVLSGILALVCGGGYTVAYYATDAFFDVDALRFLDRLGYWNLAVGGAGLCLGFVVALVGGVMMIVGRRR